MFIKNVSSCKSRTQKTPGLLNFSLFLSSTFVYKPIVIKNSMNANIEKTQIIHKMKYSIYLPLISNNKHFGQIKDLKIYMTGHFSSHCLLEIGISKILFVFLTISIIIIWIFLK